MESTKVGDKVKVIDYGEEYTGYTDMIEHMIKKFNLENEEELLSDYNVRDLELGDEGVVLAMEQHLENWSSDTLALIAIEGSYNLIGTDGLEVINKEEDENE